mgnify:CR=1 FL=1
MMEKLSAKEFDKNLAEVSRKLDNALAKIGKDRKDVILLAATKTVDFETINYALSQGIEYIGENKVQELLSKDDRINPCHRHFIGHLQTNKVKDIINRVEMIHSVDSLKLAKEISTLSVNTTKAGNAASSAGKKGAGAAKQAKDATKELNKELFCCRGKRMANYLIDHHCKLVRIDCDQKAKGYLVFIFIDSVKYNSLLFLS